MATINRRITGVTGTIPNYTVLTGTVTTNSIDNKTYNYSGSNDIATIYVDWKTGTGGNMYIFVPDAAAKLAKVISIGQVADNSWTIRTDSTVTGASASTANYVEANLVAYSFVNDGGAIGIVDGVNVVYGEEGGSPQLNPSGSRGEFFNPRLVNASVTDFYIQETR